jgi:hypothetical protein
LITTIPFLIRGAAIEAILDHSEKITRQLLDSIDLDHAAEHNNTRTTPAPQRKPRKTSNA